MSLVFILGISLLLILKLLVLLLLLHWACMSCLYMISMILIGFLRH